MQNNTTKTFKEVDDLKAVGLRISMLRKGNPYDNAQAESFIRSLKSEEVYLCDKSLKDVKKRIPYFIEEVHNQKRLHAALGYCLPNEHEELVARSINFNRQTLLRGSLQIWVLRTTYFGQHTDYNWEVYYERS